MVVGLVSIILIPAFGQPIEVYSPSIEFRIQKPNNPPETEDVTVVFELNDKFGQFTNVTLFYHTNDGPWISGEMRLINGDLSSGTFLFIIPKQPVDTEVSYYVFAGDNLGYESRSREHKYHVFADRKGPGISQVFNTFAIYPWQYVRGTHAIYDFESGVKEAVLKFSINSATNFREVLMRLVEGDKWRGAWEGDIPPQPVGTVVYYYVEAVDYNSNSEQTTLSSYTVREPDRPSAFLRLRILEIDDSSLRLLGNLYIEETIARERGVFLGQPLLNSSNRDLRPYSVQLQTERVAFETVVVDQDWNFTLIGNSQAYPADRYVVDFTIGLPGKNVDFRKHSEPLIQNFNELLKSEWLIASSTRPVSTNSNYTYVNFHLVLERQPWNVLPLLLPLLSSFLILGSTMLIENGKGRGRSDRLIVYLALYVFVVGFFFSTGFSRPLVFGLTLIDSLVLFLAFSTALFLIATIFGSSITRPLIADTSATIISVVLFTLLLIFSPNLPQFTASSYSPLVWITPYSFFALAFFAYLWKTRNELKRKRMVENW